MERPCILLSASRSGWQNYENAVLRAGGSVAGGYCPQPDAGYDGLLLCGGEDIDPDRYGQKNCGSLGIDPDRDSAEFALAEAYAAAGKPIFGICRGHQVLNVVLAVPCSRTSDRSGTCPTAGRPAQMWTESTRCGQRKTPCSAAFTGQSFPPTAPTTRPWTGLETVCASRPGRKSGLQKRSNTKPSLFFPCSSTPSE